MSIRRHRRKKDAYEDREQALEDVKEETLFPEVEGAKLKRVREDDTHWNFIVDY